MPFCLKISYLFTDLLKVKFLNTYTSTAVIFMQLLPESSKLVTDKCYYVVLYFFFCSQNLCQP